MENFPLNTLFAKDNKLKQAITYLFAIVLTIFLPACKTRNTETPFVQKFHQAEWESFTFGYVYEQHDHAPKIVNIIVMKTSENEAESSILETGGMRAPFSIEHAELIRTNVVKHYKKVLTSPLNELDKLDEEKKTKIYKNVGRVKITLTLNQNDGIQIEEETCFYPPVGDVGDFLSYVDAHTYD